MQVMKVKSIRLVLALSLVLTLGTGLVLAGKVSGDEAETATLTALLAEIKPTIIIGEITKNTAAYDDWAQNRKRIGEFAQGELVEIIRDRAFEWYYVRSEDGREGWIKVDSIWIPKDPETNREWLPKFALEAYVNSKGLDSKTDQLVWVDLDRQLTHVFTGKQGNWKLKHTMPSSTGKNVSPTLRGVHEVAERGDWFFTERLARGGQNWVQFAGPYMFHSLPMDKQQNITDYTLLERRSSGCIRLSMEDSAWFYSFIKRRTTVYVN